MEYLKDLPEDLQDKGLSKVLLVRKETIHLKHILSVLFGGEDVDEDFFNYLASRDYMKFVSNNLDELYKLPREYKYSLKAINETKKDKFYDYIKLFEQLDPVLWLDEELPFHFLENMRKKYPHLEIKIVNMNIIEELDNIDGIFNFIIANDETRLPHYWLLNFKTYFYKNKRIKNFSLYDKKLEHEQRSNSKKTE